CAGRAWNSPLSAASRTSDAEPANGPRVALARARVCQLSFSAWDDGGASSSFAHASRGTDPDGARSAAAGGRVVAGGPHPAEPGGLSASPGIEDWPMGPGGHGTADGNRGRCSETIVENSSGA